MLILGDTVPDAILLGDVEVDKIMLGDAQVWPPAVVPTIPTLVDSFTAIAPYTTAATKPFTATKVIPVGTFLAVGVALNGIYPSAGPSMSDNAAGAGAANAYVKLSGSAWLQGTNVCGAIFVCRTTRQINVGNVITFSHTEARNRGVAVAAWFNAAIPTLVLNGGEKTANGNSSAWNTGAQAGGLITTQPTLDLALTFGTSGAIPWNFGGGYTEVGEVVTAAGSAERSAALGYRVSPAPGAKSASGTCTLAVWGAGMVNLAYTP